MKLCVVLIFGCYLSAAYGLFGPQLQIKLWRIEDTCREQTGDSLASVDYIRKNRKLPEDGSLENFAICILKRYNILNADNSVNQNIRQYFLIADDGHKWDYAERCTILSGYKTVRDIFACLLNTGIEFIDFMPRATAKSN